MPTRTASLEHAFTHAHYHVLLPGGRVTVRIGSKPPVMRAWLRTNGYTPPTWSLITAWNPGAEVRNPGQNRRAQRRLEEDLDQAGWYWVPGIARDPDKRWPDEPGVWVPGMAAGEGLVWAKRVGQLAIVAGDEDGTARLCWVRQA